MTMRRVLDAAHYLIDLFDLHKDGAPVDLWPFEAYFEIERHDLSGTGLPAFLLRPSGRISKHNRAKVFVDQRQDQYGTRLCYAHEVGHGALGHPASLSALSVSEWFYDHDEREAWVFAAELLIPATCVFCDGETSVGIIAEHCRVPRWLVELYLEAA